MALGTNYFIKLTERFFILDKTLTKPKENQTLEPVELHVRISELKKKPIITEDNEKKKLKQLSFPTTFPVKETKFEERTLGEDQLQSIYAKAASFRDGEGKIINLKLIMYSRKTPCCCHPKNETSNGYEK